MFLYRLMAINPSPYLDPACMENESWYTYRRVIVYTHVCVTWHVGHQLIVDHQLIAIDTLLYLDPACGENESRYTIRMCYDAHVSESRHAYGWVMSRIWMSHVTHMDESRHAYGWVMSRIWMSHVTHMDESCHAYGWVMSRIWMSHVTQIDASCHAYGWVMSRTSQRWWCVMLHTQKSHDAHMYESCDAYG